MKLTTRLRTFVLLAGIGIAIAGIFLTGCDDKVELTQKYTIMEPVYMTPEAIREAFDVTAPVEITNTGKIYLYENFIFLNEPGKGIHVIDNTDNTAPKIISFISIPGNNEMAVRGDRMFVDSYLDLVVIDISNPLEIKEVKRINNIFEQMFQNTQYYDPAKGIVVDYEPKEVIEVSSSEFNGAFPSFYYYNSGGLAMEGIFTADMLNYKSGALPPGSVAPQTGIGGSMARFTIMSEHLYSVDNSNLRVFDITDLNNPVPGANLQLGWGVETIYPYKNTLFLGTNSGMMIYDNSDPDFPRHTATMTHIVSCDPVVVENDIAYVTLRGGSGCRGSFTNQLDVINISDLKNPKLIVSHPMTSPYGLGIDNGTLFICEGSSGLKVFDATDANKIDLVDYIGEIDAFDVIPYNNTLLLIGQDGLYQFDYTDPENLQLLSVITIAREEPLK